MWLANFEDGSSLSSKNTFWTQIPKDKRVSGVQLTHPHLPNLYVNLSSLDEYYFVNEAVSLLMGGSGSRIVAEIIGGHDAKLGVGVEVRLSYTGSINVRIFSWNKFRYSQDILVIGSRNGKMPVLETSETASS